MGAEIKAGVAAQRSGLEYGAGGVVGALVPRENPTVEAELPLLLGPGVLMLTTRMVSRSPDMLERLRDYGGLIADGVDAFGAAPIDAFAFACTGTSYLLRDAGEALPDTVTHGGARTPFISSADAIEAALAELSARTISLVSPYGDELTAAALRYWGARGFEIAKLQRAAPAPSYHSIYGQRQDSISRAIAEASVPEADVVVVLGTGAPTLGAIARAADAGGPPVLSSNLCLGWRTQGVLDDGANIVDWIGRDAAWRRRLSERFPVPESGVSSA